MAKAKNKTVATNDSVKDSLQAIEDEGRRADCIAIHNIMCRLTGWEPKMWGSIVGFGDYHYVYESGREGDSLRTGFANRKNDISIYIMPGYTNFDTYLERLGKHKKGKACLYIKRLSDVDVGVLEELIQAGLDDMAEKYPL